MIRNLLKIIFIPRNVDKKPLKTVKIYNFHINYKY